MGSSVSYKAIFLLVVNGCLFVTTHATPTPLQKVCDKTIDINFCLKVFGSDPVTRIASLPLLGKIAIDRATHKAVRTKADINKRLFVAPDPKLKDVLNQCAQAYDDVLAALRIALVDLRKGHYMNLYRHADIAYQGSMFCEEAFISTSLPSPFTTANLQLSDYCNIIEVIADSITLKMRI